MSDSSDSEVSPRAPVVLTAVQKAFVNTRLQNWHQCRAEWTAPDQEKTRPLPGKAAPKHAKDGAEIDPQVLFDCFKQCKPFPHGIPLTTMVEFLDMVWDEEGLE